MTLVPPKQPRPSSRTWGSVDISTAAAGTSDIFDVTGLTLSAIQMSTAWTQADLAFLGNTDGSTSMFALTNGTSSGGIKRYRVNANEVILVDPKDFHGIQKLQLTSIATGSTAVTAQAAARTVVLGLSEITKKS